MRQLKLNLITLATIIIEGLKNFSLKLSLKYIENFIFI